MRARRLPMIGAAAALLSGAVLFNPLPAGAVSAPPPKAAVFTNPDYVDAGEFDEADNTIETLLDGGVTVSEFTGITPAAFTEALDGTDVLVIPELESQDGDGALAADMGPESRAIVKTWVDAGGRIIVFGSSNPWVDVDAIFGTNYDGEDFNGVCHNDDDEEKGPLADAAANGGAVTAGLMTEGACTKQAVAANTEFAEGPDELVYNDDTATTPVNLPASASTVYSWIDGSAAVTSIPQGHGAIVFLAWDWFGAYEGGEEDGAPLTAGIPAEGVDTGWFTVLLLATDATVAVDDASAQEGSPVPFVISLPGGPVSQDVVVTYATVDGTAVAGTDYTATSGTAVIPRGQSSVAVDVPTLARAGAQGTRAFTLDIDAPYWAQVADPTGTGTIDDVPDATTTTTTAPATQAAQAVRTQPRFAG